MPQESGLAEDSTLVGDDAEENKTRSDKKKRTSTRPAFHNSDLN